MPTTITGTDGVSQVQTGAVESGDLPAGSVIQVVQAVYSTQIIISSSTYTDTGLSASITPSSTSSKILVITAQTVRSTNIATLLRTHDTRLLRDATQIFEKETYQWGGLGEFSATGGSIDGTMVSLDSPATTSSVTYKIQGRTNSSDGIYFQNDGSESSITLMEIAG